MARLLADENFDHRIVRALRARGHDVVTFPSPDLGEPGTPDADVLALATSLGRAVLTHDRRDFIRLHRLSPAHAGIVAVSPDSKTQEVAERIDAALQQAYDLHGQLLRVNLPA